MSGGVDSTVCAALLKKQGYPVEGVYMRNWDANDEMGVCPGESEWRQVQDICYRLNMPCFKVDLVKEYWHQVFIRGLEAFSRGETPNMDVACNREIKLGVLFEQLSLHVPTADPRRSYLVTGHYARTLQGPQGDYRLLQGLDPSKDQSYYLCQVPQKALAHTLFPLGHLYKSQVKELAREMGFVDVAAQKESMGICFIGKRRDFKDFLAGYIDDRPGDIIAPDGRVLGQHSGIHTRTIGQSVRLTIDSTKWIVAHKDIERNVLRVVAGPNHPALYKTIVNVRDVHWVSGMGPVRSPGKLLRAQCRYHQVMSACRVTFHPETSSAIQVEFVHPQRGPTPGQVLAIYDGEMCLGGGVIC
ncbi:tRNA methyl transferase [Piptocephalis cylindrospora]|uniref:tRNA-5-taurinomethyluridine 2-sulfurtransferase n=1 Tax=Piptocephalis cylindrospora TaxID=1907219 RepID=A0A4P9Y6C0_9FUNG|nr:tRNA methyl transferase [Piptocephalis cylindrospora]|eukprot:RKP14618.1 tRNA methyl transferase [Piptocephalis cylindrospora]